MNRAWEALARKLLSNKGLGVVQLTQAGAGGTSPNMAREIHEETGVTPSSFARKFSGCDSDRWWVLHTRSRHEKAVASVLEKHRVRHYLPLLHMRRTHGRRLVNVDLPLFPGYLFVRGDATACETAWRTNKVAQILHVEDQEQIHRELESIHCVVESGKQFDLYPALREGRRCRIKSGPLCGIEGVVQKVRKGWRMYVTATVLSQSVTIEIDAAALEAAE